MQCPGTPEDERSRLNALYSLKLLDTPAEERFDRYTRIVKKLLDVPIAVVSLVDVNRQWFKSCLGLDATETSREVSFCGHTILDDGVLVINDAEQDERFADNPLVTGEPGIRFYAGFPLIYVDGSRLGTLCVIDTKSRSFSTDELDILKDVANMVSRELETVQLAILDDLTGISNRRGFQLLAQKSLDLCYRRQIPACVVFFDLNGFKQINDNYGHLEGDKALVNFTHLMKDFFRSSDVFARLGGDEFVVLLTDTTIESAEKIINDFRKALLEKNTVSNKPYNLECCAGVIAVDTATDLSIDELIAMADSVMYEAKSHTPSVFSNK